jgi:hypothetical protein
MASMQFRHFYNTLIAGFEPTASPTRPPNKSPKNRWAAPEKRPPPFEIQRAVNT